MPDVYEYNDMPEKLRVQLGYMIESFEEFCRLPVCEHALHSFCKEHGIDDIPGSGRHTSAVQEVLILLDTSPGLRSLDLIEFIIRTGFILASDPMSFRHSVIDELNSMIEEMNYRFKQNRFGFEFANGEFVRIDSQYMHSEVVQEVLHLIAFPEFKSVNSEFMSAHEKYRNKDYRGCIADCGNAFESTLKVICKRNEWKYKKGQATALVDLCKEKGLFDEFHVESLNHLAGVLKSSVPTPRNNLASHGHGTEPKEITEAAAKFCLHSVASHILFLIDCDRAKLKRTD